MTVGDERMADEQTRFNASKFPKITKQAVDFYEKGASEDEKKIVADAFTLQLQPIICFEI